MREAEGVKLEWGRMVSMEQAQAGKGLLQETAEKSRAVARTGGDGITVGQNGV